MSNPQVVEECIEEPWAMHRSHDSVDNDSATAHREGVVEALHPLDGDVCMLYMYILELSNGQNIYKVE